jgi:hypothetical protein
MNKSQSKLHGSPEPEPSFDAEFQAAIDAWRKQHRLREDAAVFLCLELFRITPSTTHVSTTTTSKALLFGNVRAGKVQILMGSTQKMGTGTSVQARLIALHHLDKRAAAMNHCSGCWRFGEVSRCCFR